MIHRSQWWTLERDGVEIEVNVEFTATEYIPAQLYGLPENCHPAEGGEIEITAVFHGATALVPPLTEDEESRLIDHLYESLDESDFDDEPDWDARRDAQIDEDLTQ